MAVKSEGRLLSGQKPDARAAGKNAAQNRHTISDLNRALKEGALGSVCLLYGEEAFLRRSYRNRIRDSIIGDDEMNYSYFEGSSVDVQEIISIAETMPFFADRRLVIVENSGLFTSEAQEMTDFLERLPETTFILFVEESADKRTKLYKKVASMGTVAQFNYQTAEDLSGWLVRKAAGDGRRMSSGTASRLIDRTGIDMYTLSNELDKLIAYTEGRAEISERDIEAVSIVRLEDRIFDMIDAVAEGRRSRALELYADLLALRESPIKILVLIGRQCFTLLSVKDQLERGTPRQQIGEVCGIRVFADKYIRQAGRFTRSRLEDHVRMTVEMDAAIKRGDLDEQLAVELLLISLSGR